MGAGKRRAVVGANGAGQPHLLERPLEGGEGVPRLCRRQRLAREQIPAGKVGDGQRIAVPPIGEHELAFVVGAPQIVRLIGARERGALRTIPSPLPAGHQVVPIEDGVDRTDGGAQQRGVALTETLTELGRAPARILPLQADDRVLDRGRQLIRVPIRPATPIGEALQADLLILVVNLVAGLS